MNALLTAIILWLAANFDLPAVKDHPRIELIPAVQMAAARYEALRGLGVPEGGTQSTALSQEQAQVMAFYNDTTNTLYLPSEWTGSTPAELSILVHEMVHYLQDVANLKYHCAQAREALAFAAQERWLGLFGNNLEAEFGLDAMTILVRTKCML